MCIYVLMDTAFYLNYLWKVFFPFNGDIFLFVKFLSITSTMLRFTVYQSHFVEFSIQV